MGAKMEETLEETSNQNNISLQSAYGEALSFEIDGLPETCKKVKIHRLLREKWVRRLEDTILRHANRLRGIYFNSTTISDTSGGSGKRPNYLQTLDKRVSEADAYLQLMIEQTNKLEEKISSLSEPEIKQTVKSYRKMPHSVKNEIKTFSFLN